ncbi:hypothetical protein, partial [Vibrio splendidus]|uniref:hypothetical protein n=1 Tax=Vibrio splendidus TaxID=29497 RepID=UPI001A7E1246
RNTRNGLVLSLNLITQQSPYKCRKAAKRPFYDNVTDITPYYLVFYKSATNVALQYLLEALFHDHG